MKARAFLENNLHLTDERVIRQALGAAKIETLKKGELLLESGQSMTHLTFLIQGVLRGFLIDMNGKDITDCFAFQAGDAAMPCQRLDQKSRISIEAVTPCEVIKFPISLVLEWMRNYPELLELYNRLLVQALERHWEVKMLMYRYTAMQLYQWFLKHYPQLSRQVSSRHIASFLGMTPVTLSRLRGKIRKQKMQEISGGIEAEEQT